MKVGPLVNEMQRNDPTVIPSAVNWLIEVERVYTQLRNPAAAAVAVERGKILAALAGVAPSPPGGHSRSSRKNATFVAFKAVEETNGALRGQIADADRRIEAAKEKMVQLVAVASAKVPIPLPPSEPRDAWLDGVWKAMNTVAEVSGMCRYLGASLTSLDRRQILDDVLTQMIEAMG